MSAGVFDQGGGGGGGGGMGSGHPGGAVVAVSDDNFAEEVLGSEELVMVEFFAPWW